MKFFAAIALASAASATTLERKQSKVKDIRNFSASCVAHSVMCSYDFDIVSDPIFPATNCAAFLAGPDRLPAVTEGTCRENSAWTWATARTVEGALSLNITTPLNGRLNLTYCHTLPASDFVIDDNGSVQTERYVGPTDFVNSIDECFA